MKQFYILFLGLLLITSTLAAQEHSVAREWNEQVLNGIRGDFARPTVHARNLWHTSIGMYEAFSVYEEDAETYLLGKTIAGYECELLEVPVPEDKLAAQEEALSHAVYRLMEHRFLSAPDAFEIITEATNYMVELGFDPSNTSVDYTNGGAAEMGNYIASELINFGLQDGSNENGAYANLYYESVNPGLDMGGSGNPDLQDQNRWQFLQLDTCIDQGGNVVPCDDNFLSPEWGNVVPFSLSGEDLTVFERDGDNYNVFHDPGPPPTMEIGTASDIEDPYKWNFTLVNVWSSMLDPSDGVMWDISPASIGNIDVADFPSTQEEYEGFYDLTEGGDIGEGHDINPITGLPYEAQIVPRGDYTRILAEFWADGPESETPPGHWFTILNYVNDNPLLEKKWKGSGAVLSDLEWDVRSYFTLGGAMHDCAIAAWSVKGYYDYIRPVSVIRFMGMLGQSTNTGLGNYDPNGIPLIPGYVETVFIGDPLSGGSNENVGKIKIKAWRGPDFVADPDNDVAGVDWILAENWWPYQRPTFVTPPFAGYVSGHSTYSRGAAEVLTAITGDPFFPGGMGIFDAFENDFLVFEDGPTMDIELQWATYRDASDQCSLSRIWGGIHPPIDDIPGRLIGLEVGLESFELADQLLDQGAPQIMEYTVSEPVINEDNVGTSIVLTIFFNEAMNTESLPTLNFPEDNPTFSATLITDQQWIGNDTYEIIFSTTESPLTFDNIDLELIGVMDELGLLLEEGVLDNIFIYDINPPAVAAINGSALNVLEANTGEAGFSLDIDFDQNMDTNQAVTFSFPNEDPSNTLTLDTLASTWIDSDTYRAVFDVTDIDETLLDIDVHVDEAFDLGNNASLAFTQEDAFSIDTRRPEASNVVSTSPIINDDAVSGTSWTLTLTFDEPMDTSLEPQIAFSNGDPLAATMTEAGTSLWTDDSTYEVTYTLADVGEEIPDINLEVVSAKDLLGNDQIAVLEEAFFTVDTKNPTAIVFSANTYNVTNENEGENGFILIAVFDEPMDTDTPVEISFPVEDAFGAGLSVNSVSSEWTANIVYQAQFDVAPGIAELADIDVQIDLALDEAGNSNELNYYTDFFSINLDSSIAVNELVAEQMLVNLFPNPVRNGEDIQLTFGQDYSDLQIHLIDMRGSLIWSQAAGSAQNGNTLRIPSADLASGTYVVVLQSGDAKQAFQVQVAK